MRIEPSADMRQAAIVARQMFLALVEQGFTEEQALKVVIATMVSARDA